MSNETMIPDVNSVVGRVINSLGEPLDSKGAISGGSQSLISLDEMRKGQGELRLWETGIKVVDLLAPLARGGTFTISGERGTGEMVVIEELMQSLVSRHKGYVIGLAMDESGYDTSYLMETLKEFQETHETYREKFTLIFEPLTASAESVQRMIQVSLTLAQQLRMSGQEVMLIADDQTVNRFTLVDLESLKRFATAQELITLLIRPGVEVKDSGKLDGQIMTNHELAHQYLWPAIDRVLSTSNLLESTLVSEEHKQVAKELRMLLSKPVGSNEEQEKIQRLQHFLTQPFFVAELYTGQPGEYVPVDVTIAQIKALLDGQYANIPPEAFTMVGTIEQAVTKAASK
jgi:F-type H+-transporting ATPase subunit beta